MTPIELKILKIRARLIKNGNGIFHKVLTKQGDRLITLAKVIDPKILKDRVPQAINESELQKAFEKYYGMSMLIGKNWRKHLLTKKTTEDEMFDIILQEQMINYARTECGLRIKNIQDTSNKFLLKIVQDANSQAFADGLGVDKTRDLIISKVKKLNKTISKARAKMIAQTEMITASNKSAFFGAKSTGLDFRKFWSTSGLANVRDTHLYNEQFSIDNGGLKENEIFPNGLMFPGDPRGTAEETINCRCTLLFDTV